MRQASIWYRAKDDPDRSVRPHAQMILSYDVLPDTLRSLDAQGYAVQRVTVETLCDRCQGTGRVAYRPKGWRKMPRHLCPTKVCPDCRSVSPLVSETVIGVEGAA
jgi:hypothetical protein